MIQSAPGKSRPAAGPWREGRASALETTFAALIIVLASLVAFYLSATDSDPETLYQQNRIDSLVFTAAGNLLEDNQSPYSLENQLQEIAADRLGGAQPPYAIPFSYPPNALPMFQLRALGDPQLNAAFHTGIQVLLSLATLALLANRYLDNRTTQLVILFVAAFWTPALLDIKLAQTGHLAGFFAFSVLLLHDRKPVFAGIALGLLAFKPQYAIPLGLVFLARQSWPLLLWAIATFLVTCMLSAVLYGLAMWPEFWRSASTLNTTIFQMESWLGVAALLLPDHLETIHRMAVPVYGTAMLLLGMLVFAWHEKMDLLGSASLAVMVTLIFSPNTHPYDLSLFFIPVMYFTRYFGMRMWIAEVVFLVFLVPNIFVSVSILRFCFLLLCLMLLLFIISNNPLHPTRPAGDESIPP